MDNTVYSDTPTRPANASINKTPPVTAPQSPSMLASSSFYKECLKNHAASIGGHALDGCGEFMPSLSLPSSNPLSLKCAACGCHRNFHRRDPMPQFLNCFFSPPPPPAIVHRSFSPSTSPSPSPTPSPSTSPMSSPSPPPLSHFPPPPSSLYSAGVAIPRMFLAMGKRSTVPSEEHHERFKSPALVRENPSGKKRCRTKFSAEQKKRMYAFCEKLGWKIQKVDDGLIQEFCNEIGVSRIVFKVWMHNHKNSFRTKRSGCGKVDEDEDNSNNGGGRSGRGNEFDSDIDKNADLHAASVNGCSSSS